MEKYISRIDGLIKDKTTKTLNEQHINNTQIEGFKICSEIFDQNNNTTNFLNVLYSNWNIDKELIKMVYNHFNDVETSDEFLSIYDSEGDLLNSWELFQNRYNVSDSFPF